MATQLSSLNLDSFIFQLRQWALESRGVFGYLQMLIFGPETSKLPMKALSSLLFKAGRTKRRPKSSLTREQISIDSKVAFLLVWTAFTSLIFDILLKLLFVCLFFSYDVLKLSWLAMWEAILNLSIFYWEDLGVTFKSKLKRLENVFQSFLKSFSQSV